MHLEPATPLVIVGLGNPGASYAGSLHNLGKDWVAALGERLGCTLQHNKRFGGLFGKASLRGHPCNLYLPDSYMNTSGQPVVFAMRKLGCDPEQLLVVHDELDLQAGKARLKFGGGDAGHNGLRNIRAHLGNGQYWRLRLGVGRPNGMDREGQVGYLLSKPAPDQRLLIEAAASHALDLFVRLYGDSWEELMRSLHTQPAVPA